MKRALIAAEVQDSIGRNLLGRSGGGMTTLKTTDTTASRIRDASSKDVPDATDLAKLARLIGAYAPHDGPFALSIPGLHAVRASKSSPEAAHVMSQCGLCIVAQGAKRVILGQNVYEYDASRMVVYSAEVPVAASIIRASKVEPYFAWC